MFINSTKSMEDNKINLLLTFFSIRSRKQCERVNTANASRDSAAEIQCLPILTELIMLPNNCNDGLVQTL